jgi:hypothetical protein
LEPVSDKIGLYCANEVDVEIGIGDQIKDLLDSVPYIVDVYPSNVCQSRTKVQKLRAPFPYFGLICRRAGI